MRLHESWIGTLAGHPETGMGFQVLEVDGGYSGTQYAIVVNGTDLLERTIGPLRVRERLPMVEEVGVLEALQERVDAARFRVVTRAEAERAGTSRQVLRAMDPPAERPLKTRLQGNGFSASQPTIRTIVSSRTARLRREPTSPRTKTVSPSALVLRPCAGTLCPTPKQPYIAIISYPRRRSPCAAERGSRLLGTREVVSK